MSKFAYWLFVLSLPLLYVSSAVCLLVNNEQVYEYSFDNYHVEEITGIEKSQLREVANKLVAYFNCKLNTPQITVTKNGEEIELFHDYELTHLQDVKRLFQLNYLVQGIALTYAIVYALVSLVLGKRRWQDLARGVVRGSIVTLGLIAILGIASVLNFDWVFVQFHRLVFRNPYWLLNPSRDYLIMLFPAGFWRDIALVWAGVAAAEALLLGGVARAVLLIHQRRSDGTKTSAENGF